ncbi:helix-turn-helix domain-containing protein [Thermodesulfobacteriota bacterium]
MKRFEDFNYYEILEIDFNASYFEIRQAYRDALSIYGDDSLATYSMFTEEERLDILNKIDKAFNTLIDKKARDGYDRTLLRSGDIDATAMDKKDKKKPIPLFPSAYHKNEDAFSKRIKKRIEENETSKDMSEKILSKDIISGNDLKRLREAFDIELEDIYEAARISVSTLQSIEEDEAENLPPEVYLRNFLKNYAELLQIDSKKIIAGYLKNIHNLKAQNI